MQGYEYRVYVVTVEKNYLNGFTHVPKLTRVFSTLEEAEEFCDSCDKYEFRPSEIVECWLVDNGLE